MKNKKKLLLPGIIILVIVATGILLSRAISYDALTLLKSAPIGTGFTAKILCSGVFVSGRQTESLWKEDLELMRNNLIRGRVNFEDKSTEAYILGFLYKRKAVYREGCGCTLLIDSNENEFRKECDVELPAPPENMENAPWPDGDVVSEVSAPEGVDTQQLDKTLDWAFDDSVQEKPVRTRAVIVVYDGQIVAERYADGFSKDTRLIGWSMSKSVTGTLVGILVRDGKIDISRQAPISEWSAPDDPRSKITTDELLRMSSGLIFREEYENDPDSDAGYMLFTEKDMAAYAIAKKLEADPDKKFNYSSGTTLILSRIIRDAVGGSFQDYLAFPRRELFNKLGMGSAFIEPDPVGTMAGAAFMYATARDWARYGLLYYNDGVWNGERILPEGWVQYSSAPSSTSHEYGAQFWLNDGETDRWMPDCPPDIYSAWGHESQFVTIVPSRKTVIVRLGQTPSDSEWNHNYFVSNILKALPDGQPQ